MSETDSFIDEVTEEVRRDRLFAVMRRYGWIGILAVVLIVGGAAFVEWRRASDRAAAEAFGDALLAAMNANDPAARLAALDAVAAGDEAGKQVVRGFLAAAEALAAGDAAGAVERLDAVAALPGIPASARQLAQLKMVTIGAATMDAAERDATLADLAAPGAPFRPLAMEQQALALVAAGKRDEAVALFRQIVQEVNVTAGLRRRATQMMVALGAAPDGA